MVLFSEKLQQERILVPFNYLGTPPTRTLLRLSRMHTLHLRLILYLIRVKFHLIRRHASSLIAALDFSADIIPFSFRK